MKEGSVTFRAKNAISGRVYQISVYQSTLYEDYNIPNTDTVYLDFENTEQIDNLINGLLHLKESI